MERLRDYVAILLDPESRWCSTCTILNDVDPSEHEETCRHCIASDENKDVVAQDPYFTRIWKAAQLKRAGIPVLNLISDLDDALAIHTVETEIERIYYEKLKEEQGTEQQGRPGKVPQLLQIEE